MWVGTSGGPGTRDPGQFHCLNMSLQDLVIEAYGIAPYQFSGPPWMSEQRFDITAKVPAGATRSQMKPMLQRLLADRFHLAVHFDKKEPRAYELVVAKNGPKLRESVDDPQPAAPQPELPPGAQLGKDGFPEFPPGRTPMSRTINGHTRMRTFRITVQRLAGILATQLSRPVTDATGLKGRYDVELYWVSALSADAAAEGGPTLERALEEQLGLKLEQRKGLVDILVVDHAERIPSDN
jgi:uncharacterized protein (TIGR03435 family)